MTPKRLLAPTCLLLLTHLILAHTAPKRNQDKHAHAHTAHPTHKNCGFKHNLLKKIGVGRPLSKKITQDPKHRVLWGSGPHKFKVHLDTSNVKGVTTEVKDYLVNLVAKHGNKIFAEKIGITGYGVVESNANIPKYCSYDNIVQVPSDYGHYDTDADFILFLATDDTGNDGTLAYATACFLEHGTKRPNVGFAVVNPYYLKPRLGKLENDVATYVHEVLHALVFSSTLWKNFPLVNGKTQYFISGGNHYLRGPKLLQIAREHFDCPSISRIPLEDDGGDGSKGGHWERVVFGNETMVSEDIYTAEFSKMTLALMHDSGWYNIDVAKGDYYTWGKGEGCEIFSRTGSQANIEETCDLNNNFGCDKTFRNKMICHATTFTGNRKIKTRGDSCLKEHPGMRSFEYANENAKCQEFRMDGKKYASCQHISCTSDKSSYRVYLKSGTSYVYYDCYHENSSATWNGKKFFCENPAIICGSLCPKDCLNRGKCLENGECSCNPFYSGAICGTYDGCGDLSSSTCSTVLSANKLSTESKSNYFSSADYDRNYLNHSSWDDLETRRLNTIVNTDTGL